MLVSVIQRFDGAGAGQVSGFLGGVGLPAPVWMPMWFPSRSHPFWQVSNSTARLRWSRLQPRKPPWGGTKSSPRGSLWRTKAKPSAPSPGLIWNRNRVSNPLRTDCFASRQAATLRNGFAGVSRRLLPAWAALERSSRPPVELKSEQENWARAGKADRLVTTAAQNPGTTAGHSKVSLLLRNADGASRPGGQEQRRPGQRVPGPRISGAEPVRVPSPACETAPRQRGTDPCPARRHPARARGGIRRTSSECHGPPGRYRCPM